MQVKVFLELKDKEQNAKLQKDASLAGLSKETGVPSTEVIAVRGDELIPKNFQLTDKDELKFLVVIFRR